MIIESEISEHFIRTFKSRNKIIYRKIFGESKSADKSKIAEGFAIFNEIKKNFAEEDIFNFDETSLFMKAQNYHSYMFSDDDRK